MAPSYSSRAGASLVTLDFSTNLAPLPGGQRTLLGAQALAKTLELIEEVRLISIVLIGHSLNPHRSLVSPASVQTARVLPMKVPAWLAVLTVVLASALFLKIYSGTALAPGDASPIPDLPTHKPGKPRYNRYPPVMEAKFLQDLQMFIEESRRASVYFRAKGINPYSRWPKILFPVAIGLGLGAHLIRRRTRLSEHGSFLSPILTATALIALAGACYFAYLNNRFVVTNQGEYANLADELDQAIDRFEVAFEKESFSEKTIANANVMNKLIMLDYTTRPELFAISESYRQKFEIDTTVPWFYP